MHWTKFSTSVLKWFLTFEYFGFSEISAQETSRVASFKNALRPELQIWPKIFRLGFSGLVVFLVANHWTTKH